MSTPLLYCTYSNSEHCRVCPYYSQNHTKTDVCGFVGYVTSDGVHMCLQGMHMHVCIHINICTYSYCLGNFRINDRYIHAYIPKIQSVHQLWNIYKIRQNKPQIVHQQSLEWTISVIIFHKDIVAKYTIWRGKWTFFL